MWYFQAMLHLMIIDPSYKGLRHWNSRKNNQDTYESSIHEPVHTIKPVSSQDGEKDPVGDVFTDAEEASIRDTLTDEELYGYLSYGLDNSLDASESNKAYDVAASDKFFVSPNRGLLLTPVSSDLSTNSTTNLTSSLYPSTYPSFNASSVPTAVPSIVPSDLPSVVPSAIPSSVPSAVTSADLSAVPSLTPIVKEINPPSFLASSSTSSYNHDSILQEKFCNKKEDRFVIEFKTDWTSQRDNTIYIDTEKKWGFQNVKKIVDFPTSMLPYYTICLRKSVCHRFRIYDKKGNGIGFGWYKLFWQGKEIYHDPYTDSKKQQVVFGNCIYMPA